jgi:hypothetical protein
MIADGLCMPPTAGRRHRPKGVESPLLREEIEQFVLYARARYPERWHQKKIIGIAQDLYGSAATLAHVSLNGGVWRSQVLDFPHVDGQFSPKRRDRDLAVFSLFAIAVN